MKVIIVGAGVAGLTLAHVLSRGGHRVLLVEERLAPRGDYHVVDLSGAGHEAAERLGILDALEERAAAVERIAFHDAAGREFASLAYPAFKRSSFRSRHLVTTRGTIEGLLRERIRSDVDVLRGVTVDEITTSGAVVRARLSDGSTPAADLLVGADGLRSGTRAMMFGLPERSFRRFVGYRAAAFVLDDEKLARALGAVIHVLAARGRQVTTFPVGPSRVGFLLVHRSSDDRAEDSRSAVHDEIRREYAGISWVLPLVAERLLAIPELHFDACWQVDVPQWSAGPLVLVGDAAHAASPLVGHGASLAMAGAVALGEEIAKDAATASLRYEARMRPFVAAVQRAGISVGPWLVPDSDARVVRHRLAARFARFPLAARVVRGLPGARLAESHAPFPRM